MQQKMAKDYAPQCVISWGATMLEVKLLQGIYLIKKKGSYFQGKYIKKEIANSSHR